MDVFIKGDSLSLLGGSWHVFESNGSDSFRWVGENARLNVAQLTRAPYELAIEIEPGAAVGNKPFDLAILENGTTFASARVVGRETIRIDLGSGEPRVRELTLQTQNTAPPLPLPSDPRVLKYRVFKISVERKAFDVVSLADGLKPAQGWYPLEKDKEGETFRWVGPEAVIETQNGAHVDEVSLDIEPGPGVGGGPLKLRIWAGDKQHGEVVVKYRERIAIPWPKSTNGAPLRLRVEGGGKLIPSDPRVMNFRAFTTVD